MFATDLIFKVIIKVLYTVCLGPECFAPDKTHAAPRHTHCGSFNH